MLDAVVATPANASRFLPAPAGEGLDLGPDPTSRFAVAAVLDQGVPTPAGPRLAVLKRVAGHDERRLQALREQVRIVRRCRSSLLPVPLAPVRGEPAALAPCALSDADGIVWEAVGGPRLRTLLSRQHHPWPLAVRLDFLIRVAQGLLYLLRQGYGSFDLTPWHIAVRPGPEPALLGIGSLCALDAGDRFDHHHPNFRATRRCSAPPAAYDDATARRLDPRALAAWSVQLLLAHLLLWRGDLPNEWYRGSSTIVPERLPPPRWWETQAAVSEGERPLAAELAAWLPGCFGRASLDETVAVLDEMDERATAAGAA